MKVVSYSENRASLSADRLAVLAKKIYDKAYLDNAIQRMAAVLSRQLVDDPYERK
ncbi:MAG: hypothetical protein LBS97_03515 [Treponema sp.]|jgi:hypothetical protein|nr:hypothetical protein [Treponema sp.]